MPNFRFGQFQSLWKRPFFLLDICAIFIYIGFGQL